MRILRICARRKEKIFSQLPAAMSTRTVFIPSRRISFYGGLYRGVNLICVPEAHFNLEYYGSPGFQVTPKPCDCGGALVPDGFIESVNAQLIKIKKTR